MITIYGIQSPHVARLRAALVWKGLPFQHISVNLGNKSEEFKKLTLTETIPVMEDNGIIINDSVHALDYLDHHYPHTYPMLGRNEFERVNIFNGIAAVDKIGSELPPLYIEKFNLKERFEQFNASHRALLYTEKQKLDLQNDVHYRLGKIKKVLRDEQFFTGQFSAADAALLALLGTIEFLGLSIGSWKEWQSDLLRDSRIALMFAPQTEKGIKEI